MRSVLSSLIVLVLLFSAFGCASGGAHVNLTPTQAWNIGKNAAKSVGVGLILAGSKDGKILGVSSADAISAIGPAVDTLAADFQPGVTADAAAREKTRQLAAANFARELFKSDFKATDDAAQARQQTDVAAVRAIIDGIADSLLATFGK